MANGGYLVPPSLDQQKSRLWEETWKRLERFLPNLYQDTFPELANPPAPPPQSKEEPVQPETNGQEKAEEVPEEEPK